MPEIGGQSVLTLFGIFIGIGVLVFGFQQWGWPIIQGMLNVNAKMPGERAAELMGQYMRDRDRLESTPRDFSLAAPLLSILRTGRKDDTMMCILANRGGTASNLHVEAGERVSVTIEPRSMLKNAETARILLRGVDPRADSVQIQLSYDDSYGQRTQRTFSYTRQASTFKEI